MNQQEKTITPHIIQAPLYRHVFYGWFSFVAVLLLLVSIILQPIDRAFADDVPQTNPPQPIDTSLVLPSNVDSTQATDTTNSAPIPPPEAPATTTLDTEPDQTASTTEVATSASSTSLETEATSTTSPDNTTENTLSTATDSGTDSPKITPVSDVQPDTSLSLMTDSTTTATTSGEVLTASVTVESDSQIQFEKSDCVAVADGSYYCKVKDPAPVSDIKDGLYSQPDIDGDLEIYFAHGGVMDQISHNTVDDASPYYDAVSNTIVWHRLIDDRYQIISYDVSSGAESQLTTDTVNNMEPTRVGKYTAWQHWNTDNWDIMLNDGATTKLLTNTPEHDIAPKIRGNLVIWNRLAKDKTQTIELYDLTSGEYTSIADSEGGELSNPRMVLVYDAAFANGDVVTKGYDVMTGEITPLSAVPASIPDEIPLPDKTGETRALLQAKSTSREDTDGALLQTPKIDPPDPIASSTQTSTTSSMTLDMQSAVIGSTTATATSGILTEPNFTLDLSLATPTLQIIESDILVPPFIATTTEF